MMKSIFKNYLELTKPRLVSLVLLSAAVGFVMATQGHFLWMRFLITLLGTTFCASGSMALNQWMESSRDALMKRTASRPIPQNKISSTRALIFGLITSAIGIAVLFTGINPLAGVIAAATVLSYILVYTPLKVITAHSTLIGALPGALPPLIGWAAVRGDLSLQAWSLFAIVFFWQMPHFLTLSWMLRDQYQSAGFRMLAVLDPSGKQVVRETLIYSIILVPVSVFPSFAGLTGSFYFWTQLILSGGFVGLVWKHRAQFTEKARFLFRMSLAHLSILQVVMMINKI